MTPIVSLQVIEQESVVRHARQCAAVGIALGIILASIAWHFATQPAAAVIDPRMERACGTWPRHEAEVLLVFILGGKVHCWEMGRGRGE